MSKRQHNEPKKRDVSMFAGNFRIIDVLPTEVLWRPDSIVNIRTGMKTPVMYTQMAVQVGKEMDYTYLILSSSSTLLSIVFGVSALIFFILLILSINRSHIFEWKNVSRLRWMGSLLIISFTCDLIPQIANYWGLKEIFALDKYIVAPFALEATDLLLGLGCLIVAEAFAIGLRIKEEQELTI